MAATTPILGVSRGCSARLGLGSLAIVLAGQLGEAGWRWEWGELPGSLDWSPPQVPHDRW